MYGLGSSAQGKGVAFLAWDLKVESCVRHLGLFKAAGYTILYYIILYYTIFYYIILYYYLFCYIILLAASWPGFRAYESGVRHWIRGFPRWAKGVNWSLKELGSSFRV